MPDPRDAGSVKQVIQSMMGAAISSPDLVHQAELQLIANLADSVQKCASAVQEMRRDQSAGREVDRLAMQEIRERLIRIEENRVGEDLKKLTEVVAGHTASIDELETERDRRDGATSLLNWLLKNWPAIIGFVALFAVVLKANGKL